MGKRTYQVHWAVFHLLKQYLAECYGVDLLVDVFASSGFSLLPRCGVSAIDEVLEVCRLEGHAVFIHADWARYDTIIRELKSLQLLCVIVAPMWEQHDWYGQLLSFSSHVWFLPSCNGVLSPLSRGAESQIGSSPWHVVGTFADFRKKAAVPIVRHLPPLRECIPMAKCLRLLSRRAAVSSLDLKACLPKPPFDVEFLRKVSHSAVVGGLREHVLDSIENGFASGYSGGSFFSRDFSIQLDGDALKHAMAKMEKELKKGFYLGPFDECPFPSPWCKSQAFICQLFLIPKHKFVKDGEFRLIANRSFPDGRSFNDLVDRRDCTAFIPGYSYYTFQAFLEQVRRLGPRCLIGLFDVKDAYKHCRMRHQDLWQQIYLVGGKYFVDLGGMFGSRNAGDAWNLVMEFLAQCIRHHCSAPELQYFVDNGINITPAVEGKESLIKANQCFKKILDFLEKAGVPFHDVHWPSTLVRFLGWIVDTVKMIVTCPEERLRWVRDILNGDPKKITKKFVRSWLACWNF